MSKQHQQPSWFLQMVENPTIIVLLVGVAYGYATLSSDVERNANELIRVQTELHSEMEEVNASLQDQSARFELYLDSLRVVRTDSETSFEILDESIDDLERRLLIIEQKNEQSQED